MKATGKLARMLIVLVFLLTAVPLAGCGRTGTAEDAYQQAREVARTMVWKDINEGKASSGSVAILDNGRIVYAEGFGMADREKNLPVTDHTIFNMGSVSKAFCAAAVMKLVDDGKVELDRPVTEYLPEFKMEDPRYGDVTVRMLLDHTPGFPGTAYNNNMGYEFNTPVYEETLANLARSHLKAAPGQTAPYCNDGFTVAEILITKVTGRDYMEYLTGSILAPLYLGRTGQTVGMRDDPDYAAFYQADTGRKVPPEVLSLLGAGGLSATPEDLVLFADSLSKGGRKVLSEASIAEMTKAQPSPFAAEAEKETGINPEMSYGLGLDLTEVPYYKEKGIRVIGKGGDTEDYHTMMISAPDERVAVAVMEAGHGSSAPAIAFDVMDAVLIEKGLMKKEQAEVGPPPQAQPIPAEYGAFAGRYAGDTDAFDISFDFDRNVADVAVSKKGVVATTLTLTYRDGFFHSESGSRFAFISVGGRHVLLSAIFGDKAFMTFGQLIPPLEAPGALAEDLNGRVWLLRNARRFDGIAAASNHVTVSSLSDEHPGYVDFGGLKRIESPEFAGMVQDVIRDLTELTLFSRDGQTWARVSDMIFSPVETAAPLGKGSSTVTIGKEGYNEWLSAGEDLVLDVKKASKNRVIVFTDGNVAYDSVVDSGNVFVPAGSLIELSGDEGDTFELTAG